MAKKEISIVIRARNAMAEGIASAYRSLSSLGSHVLKIGKWIGAGLLAGGAAVTAFAVKALSAYGVQQKAARSLSSAISSYGENASALVPKLQKVASAIQDETGAADEATLATMARLKILGVQTSRLEEAAKATIALKSVGMEEAAASKAVAMAMQGQYTMLNRYVPALRNATSETEKAAIVNDLFAKGYQQQKDLLGTTSGAWMALKGRIGDALESIGEAIEKSAGLQSILQSAGDAVKSFGEKVDAWIKSDQFIAIQDAINGTINAIKQGGPARSEMFGKMADVVSAAFKVAAERAATILKEAAPVIARIIGGGVKAIWESAKPNPIIYTADEEKYAQKQLGINLEGRASTLFGGRYQGDEADRVKEQIKKNRAELNFVAATTIPITEGQTKAEAELAAALASYADAAKEANRVAKESNTIKTEGLTLTREEVDAEYAKDAALRDSAAATAEAASAEQYKRDRAAANEYAVEQAKAAEEEANATAEKAKEKFATKRELFLSKDARNAEKEASRQAAREKRQIENFNKIVQSSAFKRGRVGGQGIARGIAAAAAEREARDKAAAVADATNARIAAEKKMQADIEKTAKAAEKTAKNTEFLEDELTPGR